MSALNNIARASASFIFQPPESEPIGRFLALFVKVNRCESLNDLPLTRENALISQDELKHRGVLLGSINVVLDLEGADLIGGWEALDLAVGNGAHKSRLSGTILAAETIAVATLDTENSVVE